MSLRMFEGQTGDRLIAEMPTSPDEVAVITLGDDTTVLVHHTPGIEANGYPALVPDEASLPPHVFDELKRRREALTKHYGIVCAAVLPPVTRGSRDQHRRNRVHTIERTLEPRLQNRLAEINGSPICTTVAVGRFLQLRLPPIFTNLGRTANVLNVGVIAGIMLGVRDTSLTPTPVA